MSNKLPMGDKITYFGINKLYYETIDGIELFKEISIRDFANMELEKIIIKLNEIKDYANHVKRKLQEGKIK